MPSRKRFVSVFCQSKHRFKQRIHEQFCIIFFPQVEEKKAQVAQKLVRINIEVERFFSEGIEHKTKAMEQRLMLIPVTAECDALRR